MSYLVLARKYRPQTFDQLVQQDHVTQTLKNAVVSKRVAHAILFTGPRGTGKTTVARVLAKAMNCEKGPAPVPCNVCRSCKEITSGNAVDVFEIDGASNNGVDQVRELRENLKYMPAYSRYKIYIIDEVHMLSVPAFNALLKTLEEPPAHVMFFFATTEPTKIPITILSRCQRHDFRRIDLDSIVAHMTWLCEQEKVKIPEESLLLIAREAGGSMRDALSLLDQVMICSEGDISHDQVMDILGSVDRNRLFEISEAVIHGDIKNVLIVIDDLFNRGLDMKKIYADLVVLFRNFLIMKIGPGSTNLVDLPGHEVDLIQKQIKDVPLSFLHQIFDIFFREEPALRLSSHPKFLLEMVFIRMFQTRPTLPINELIDKLELLRQGIQSSDEKEPHEEQTDYSINTKEHQGDVVKDSPKPFESRGRNTSPPPGAPPEETVPEGTESRSAVTADDFDKTWKQLFDAISKNYPSIAPNLVNGSLTKMTDKILEISVSGNEYNINMVKRKRNMAAIRKVAGALFGQDREIIISTRKIKTGTNSQKHIKNRLKQEALSQPLVSEIIEVFNGRVLDVKC